MGEIALSNSTYQAYLALEAESDAKYEFHDGMITAMAGGTLEHGQIAMNAARALGNALEAANKPCITYSSDVKVHIASSRRTFYPDASIVCGKAIRSEKDPNALSNPILILEVLSDSTASFDRGAKFTHYRQMDSLKEYVLISQSEAMVDTYYRTEDGTWEINTITDLMALVRLKSIDCEIRMADIYRLVPGIDGE